MKLSKAGLEFIAGREGLRLEPYNDGAVSDKYPKGHASIGYGHLIHKGQVTQQDRVAWAHMNRARALDLLRMDAAVAEAAVNREVHVALSQAQFDALVSLAFNIGTGAFKGSTLVRVLNQGNYREAADQFLRWDRAGMKVLPGLTHRRQAEREMFLEGEKVKRWEARLERVRADAAKHGWTLRRRIYARTLKALIGART